MCLYRSLCESQSPTLLSTDFGFHHKQFNGSNRAALELNLDRIENTWFIFLLSAAILYLFKFAIVWHNIWHYDILYYYMNETEWHYKLYDITWQNDWVKYWISVSWVLPSTFLQFIYIDQCCFQVGRKLLKSNTGAIMYKLYKDKYRHFLFSYKNKKQKPIHFFSFCLKKFCHFPVN